MAFPSSKTLTLVASHLLLSGLWIGCGPTVVVEAGDAGAAGDSGASGSTMGTTSSSESKTNVAPTITGLRAPDELSIRIEVNAAVEGALEVPEIYVLTSAHGPLKVTAVHWDAAAKAISLETEKQKLGVEYTLVVSAPGDALDGLGGTLLAADTATFWATDFATFEPYQLVAERVGVGERVVLYVDPAHFAQDIDETIAQFDGQIFPIETELFHAAPDRDENGRIVLLGLDGQDYYGGYFDPLNTLTEKEALQWGYHSNEMEILFLNVATMGGFYPDVVVVHEFGHLLYEEQHPFIQEPEYFPYHNEGLAECAAQVVYGSNKTAANFYINDMNGQLATGKSLVIWDYGNYTQYAQAYIFWTYVASQLGGASGYRDMFLSHGSPPVIDELLLEKLGASFTEVQLSALAAAWAQAPTGKYGFEGMLALPGKPATVPFGTPAVDLEPFAGAFFPQANDLITPVGAGPDVRFIALNAAGQVDVDAPFEAAGGVVIALNGHFDWNDATPQSSGALGASMAAKTIAAAHAGSRDPAWLHPPPLPPADPRLRAWRERTSGF